MSKPTLDSLKTVGIDVDGAVKELREIKARQDSNHTAFLAEGKTAKGKPPEVSEGQVRAVVRKYFTVADTEAAFNAAVEAVKAAL